MINLNVNTTMRRKHTKKICRVSGRRHHDVKRQGDINDHTSDRNDSNNDHDNDDDDADEDVFVETALSINNMRT